MSNVFCCNGYFKKKFHSSKAQINTAEIGKTPSSPNTSKEIVKDPENENRTSLPTSLKDRRQSKDVTYWIPSISEKILLRETWSDDFDFLFSIGSNIYYYIFENEPGAIVLFPKIQKYTGFVKSSGA
uniref:Uncharacterized protein n=1 Tax=Acrobeloides nanus TaxID=290746 RepID=A0A914CIB6_9BILA